MNLNREEEVSSKEITRLDSNSEWLGIPKVLLMECAGYSSASEILKRYNLNPNSRVVIFCGTGNNGGDGFVIARQLSSFSIKSLVVLIGNPEKIRTSEARLNWNILANALNFSVDIEIIKDSTDVGRIGIIFDKENHFELIIDALLGTGIKGKLREPISTTIDFINEISNQAKISVVSIDVPSGMNPDTGEVEDKAVKSDLTISFHRAKKGLNENSLYINKLAIQSIGIPLEAQIYVGRGDLLPTLKTRKLDNHKGQFGRMLVIGGSRNYSGAPAYTSLTGVHFGLDLVITYVPEVIANVLRSYSPNMIVRSHDGEWLNLDCYEELKRLVDWANVIVIGPGLGQEIETENLLVELLKYMREFNKSCVLDADALKLVKNHLPLLKHLPIILTPHAGELKIMTQLELPSYNYVEKRVELIQNLAYELGTTLLVKGTYDYISNGQKTQINTTGCAEMSIGGTGDVLAGLCGCFLGIENDPFESACSAAFLNGLLGEHCKKNIGSRFNTMDMIYNINNVLEELVNNSNYRRL